MVGHVSELETNKITNPEALNASMKVLISQQEGWDDYVMRIMEVEPNGYTPRHRHPWPHINYMLEGVGELMVDGEVNPVKPGSFAYVPQNALHQFRNTGKSPFKFICIVPKEGHK